MPAGRKPKRGYRFSPDEWENVQNQIGATIALIERRIMPEMPEVQAIALRGYLHRMQDACRPREADREAHDILA